MTVLKLVTKLKVWGIKAVTMSQMKKNKEPDYESSDADGDSL